MNEILREQKRKVKNDVKSAILSNSSSTDALKKAQISIMEANQDLQASLSAIKNDKFI